MSRLVYGCRFEIPDTEAFDRVVIPQYEAWLTKRYLRAHGLMIAIDLGEASFAGDLPEHHSIDLARFDEGGKARRVIWSFPGENGMIWRNVARMAATSEGAIVEHQVILASSDYQLAPAPFSLGAPAVIREICEQAPIAVGDMRLRAIAYPLVYKGIDDFVTLLQSPLRRLPIVLTTCFAGGDLSQLNHNSLARRLAGVAIVATAQDPETTRALSDKIGKLGVYDGGARIYWPGLSLEDDIRRHPLYFGSRIAALGPERAEYSIERTIFSISSFRFVPDIRIDQIVNATEAAQRAERVATAIEDGDLTWENYALEISRDLDAAKAELISLRAENSNLRDNQAVLFASVPSDSLEEQEEEQIDRDPSSVMEAVLFAKEDCSNLVFLETCDQSAAASPFKRPKEIYWALSMMDKTAETWKKNQGGGDLRQMLIESGLGKRVSNFISQTSKGKYGDEYMFMYDGERMLFSFHVTLGAGSADTCASIHFLPDVKNEKLVIAHIGRHLSNTKS